MSSFLELKSCINNWNTDNEEVLIRKLKEFTDGYASKTKDILTSISELESNIIKVETSYYNSLNNLKTMSIKKFVEHSVGNDEIKQKNTLEDRKQLQFKSKEEKEQVLISNYKKALSISLDKLSIKDLIEVKANKDDLVDDNVSMSSSTLLNGKNSNKAGIRLPYIIGQEGFFKHTYCGITVDEIIEKSDRTDTMKTNVYQDISKNQNTNISNNQNGNQILDNEKAKSMEYDAATLNIMLTNNNNYEKEVYNADIDKSNLNFNFDANSIYTKVTKNVSKEDFVKKSMESNIPPVTLECKEIPKLRNSTLKETKVVENKGSNIPNIPKISIPIPNIKPKNNNVSNNNNNSKVIEPVIENKPEKLDFRTELLRKLNAKGNQDNDKTNTITNPDIKESTNNNVLRNSQTMKNPSNLSNTGIHRNSVTNSKNEIRRTLEKNANDEDDEEVEGGSLFSNVVISGRQKTNTIFVRPTNMTMKNNLFSNIKEEDDDAESETRNENKSQIMNNDSYSNNVISKTNQLNNVEKVEIKSNKKLQSK